MKLILHLLIVACWLCQIYVTAMTPWTRKCAQSYCDSDSGCDSTNVADGSICPWENYCSVAKTTIYDNNNNEVRSIVTRGCASSSRAVDECAFTSIYQGNTLGYSEYTCSSTCDTDNCNMNTPNGILDGNEKPRLFCAQCSGGRVSCPRSACPSTATHCKSTVVYMISSRTDLSYTATPVYNLVSAVRECSTESVPTGCTEKYASNLSFKNVTCQETCTEDGCNTGWPARPKCLQCSSSHLSLGNGYDQCLENPEPATDCMAPYHAYCTINDYGIKEGTSESMPGYTRRIVRGCSHYDIGNGCSKTTPRETAIQSCNFTCTTDGCNVGNVGIKLVAKSAVLMSLLGLLFQIHMW